MFWKPSSSRRGAHGGDPSVHHVRGGHHVRPGLGVGQGHLGQDRHAGVVHHLAALHDPAVAVVGVGAEADVGHHDEVLPEGLLQGLHRQGHDPPGVVAVLGQGALVVRDAEEEDRGEPQLQVGLHLAAGVVDPGPGDAREGLDVGLAGGGADEVGLDEVSGPEVRLGDELADRGGAAQTAGSNEHGHSGCQTWA